jgi:hypothetical protein
VDSLGFRSLANSDSAGSAIPVTRSSVLSKGKPPSDYAELGLRSGQPIWRQYLENPDSVMWVPQPQRADAVWAVFVP